MHDGSIGLVGASGTGLQAVMVQIDRLGGGVSHAIGLGGRDLGAEVGGISCLQALRALDDDARTRTVVLISKPPAPAVRDDVISVAQTLSKPVVAHLVGDRPQREVDGNVHYARTLEEAARIAVALAGPTGARDVTLRPEQRWIKALYTGGSLAAEAAALLSAATGDGEHGNGYVMKSGGHEVIDLGDDRYTRGRVHPMIDPTLRTERIPAVFADPENAVLLLDVVLGHGSATDPGRAARVGDRRRSRPTARRGPGHRGRRVGLRHRARPPVAGRADGRVGARRRRRARRQRRRDPPRRRNPAPHAGAIAPGGGRRLRRSAGCSRRRRGSSTSVFVNSPSALHGRGAQVVHYDWAPVAGGDPKLQALLESLG